MARLDFFRELVRLRHGPGIGHQAGGTTRSAARPAWRVPHRVERDAVAVRIFRDQLRDFALLFGWEDRRVEQDRAPNGASSRSRSRGCVERTAMAISGSRYSQTGGEHQRDADDSRRAEVPDVGEQVPANRPRA